PLFFTGHSLGGALAIISAMRTRDVKLPVTAVYTFGGARAGDRRFFDNYGPDFGRCTFRLVHGTDVVASVPPSLRDGIVNRTIGFLLGGVRGGFRHVGRLLHCRQRTKFAGPVQDATDGNDPDDFLAAGFGAARDIIKSIPKNLEGPAKLDPKTLDSNTVLPEQIRDHVTASSFGALNMPLAPPP